MPWARALSKRCWASSHDVEMQGRQGLWSLDSPNCLCIFHSVYLCIPSTRTWGSHIRFTSHPYDLWLIFKQKMAYQARIHSCFARAPRPKGSSWASQMHRNGTNGPAASGSTSTSPDLGQDNAVYDISSVSSKNLSVNLLKRMHYALHTFPRFNRSMARPSVAKALHPSAKGHLHSRCHFLGLVGCSPLKSEHRNMTLTFLAIFPIPHVMRPAVKPGAAIPEMPCLFVLGIFILSLLQRTVHLLIQFLASSCQLLVLEHQYLIASQHLCW